MTDYLQHRCADGERWDLLAHRYYGDVSLQGELIEANKALFLTDYRIPEILSAGVILRIPIRERTSSVPASQLPPWKR